MYALHGLWAAAALWALVLMLDERSAEKTDFSTQRSWRLILPLACFNAAGLWTHYSYPFVMLAQGAVFLAWLVQPASKQTRGSTSLREFVATRGRTFLVYAAANALSIALFAPWLSTAIPQITGWPNTGVATPLPEALSTILNWLAFGIAHAAASPGALAVAYIIALFGLLPRRDGLWRLLVPVACTLVPLAAFLAFDLFRPANLKFLLPAQVGLALWLARGAWVLWRWNSSRTRRRGETELQRERVSAVRLWVFRGAAVVGVGFVALNSAAGLAPLYHDPAYQRADYRAIAATIESDLRSGDAVILDAPNQEEVFRYYYRADAPVYPLPPGLGGDDAATRAAVEQIIAQHARAFVVFWGETERDPNRIVETTLDTGAYEIGDVWYGDVRLARYAMPAPLTITERTGARFGEHITLERYALSGDTLQPGDVLQLRLDWQTDAPLDTRYKVFVQLLDETGRLAAQRDSEPGGGLALTTTWTPGESVSDAHGLVIPPELAPGTYTLIVGLYPLDDPSARLRVENSDHLKMRRITIG
jgi:hypothetical protein